MKIVSIIMLIACFYNISHGQTNEFLGKEIMNSDLENSILNEIENIVSNSSVEKSSYLASLIFKYRNRKISSSIIQALHKMSLENEEYPVIEYEYLVDPNPDSNFFLLILDIFQIKGKGTVVTGIVSNGTLNIGDSLVLEKSDGRDFDTICQDIHFFTENDNVIPGTQIGVFLKDLCMEDIQQGDAIIKI